MPVAKSLPQAQKQDIPTLGEIPKTKTEKVPYELKGEYHWNTLPPKINVRGGTIFNAIELHPLMLTETGCNVIVPLQLGQQYIIVFCDKDYVKEVFFTKFVQPLELQKESLITFLDSIESWVVNRKRITVQKQLELAKAEAAKFEAELKSMQ